METYLQPSDIEGTWTASYSARQEFFEPDTDASEQARINFESGVVTGFDPYGGLYSGNYFLDGEKFSATVTVTVAAAPDDDDVETVFEGLNYPFTLELSGEYLSPDYFSVGGKVVGRPEFEIVINCRREQRK